MNGESSSEELDEYPLCRSVVLGSLVVSAASQFQPTPIVSNCRRKLGIFPARYDVGVLTQAERIGSVWIPEESKPIG